MATRPTYLPNLWRPPGLPVWNPGTNPAISSRVRSAASGLLPLAFPDVPQQQNLASQQGAPTPPPGYGDLINMLLSGLGGSPSGTTPEEGLAQARRALIQYGGVPQGLSGLKQLKGAFDSGTSSLAQANTKSGISLLARINEAHDDRNRYIKNRLAARGILQSGETGFQLGREQTNYARAQADSSGKLLDYLAGINAGIAQYLQWQAQMEALQKALANLYAPQGFGPSGGAPQTQPQVGGGGGAPPEVYGSYSSGTYYPFLRQQRGRRNVYL